MQCPKCKAENPEGAKFCMNCAEPLILACAKCGTELPLGAKFCFICAAPVARPAPTEEAKTDTLPEYIQRLIPKQYAERLLASRGQMERERRLVTILFCDVRGSTAMAEKLDPEEWSEIMNAAFEFLVTPIYHHEGTLAQLLGDGLLAFFGAPLAHEDDPERAIRAGLDITAGVQSYAAKLQRERGILAFNVRVGINTGLVVIGEMGSDLRVAYTAMGDAINLAARMEQNAPPGSILITDDTYRHVRGIFDVLPQQPLTVKGKAAPVQTYLVQRAKARALRKPVRGVEGIETRMIGRQAELNRLQEAFYTAIEDRELQMATIVGEAGVGKSRLLHEFDLWSELLPESFYFFKGRASQAMQGLPYSLIRDLFAIRFQIEDTDPLPAVRRKLEQGLSAALSDSEESHMRAHIIGHLLGFELGTSPHLEGVLDDPKEMRDRALSYLADYFGALASRDPVLILLEDLHWADDSSLDVLNHLALALTDQPVMIVGTSRPLLFERRPHWGEGQPFHRRLILEPLTKRNTRRLLEEILQKVADVPETLSELVVASAEGNPFFVEELVKMLVEDGVIVKGEDQWQVQPSRLTDVQVPSTLRGVLQARVDRLPLQDRSILQQASVVGRLFWDRAVTHISQSATEGVEEAQVLSSLSKLRNREMVFQRETTAIAGAQEYIFKHAVLREVTYRSLLKRLRKTYHGLVADWLIEQAGERAGEYTALIADHLELAGRTVQATEYLLEAADRARGLYAHQEAIQAYERALALLKEQEDHERAARTWMKLGLTYHTAFDFQQARIAYDKGFSLWQRAAEAESASPHAPAARPLRLVWQGGPATLDPCMSTWTASGEVIRQLFSGLVQVTPELDVVPDVAHTWQMLQGGRQYVFHLRDDVRWSDGTPVTALDFEYAWKRLLNPANESRNAGLLYDLKGGRAYHRGEASDPESVGVRAADDLTLLVELEVPTGYFLNLIADPRTYAVPRHVAEAYGRAWTELGNIVTNGPFVLEAWHPHKSMVLTRNPRYHGRLRGNVQRVELTQTPTLDWSALFAMYETDALDVLSIHGFPPEQLKRARLRHADEYVSVPELCTFSVAFAVSKPPFNDARVRRAFVLATDREATTEATTGGALFPATGGVIPPGMAGHSPGIGLPYDPERARQLLATAGYPGGRGFPAVQLLVWCGRRSLAEHLQTKWRETLGIEIMWEEIEVQTYLDAIETALPHAFLWGWAADYPDPDNFLRVGLRCPDGGWRNEAYDVLVEEARRLTDQGKRMELYREADSILIEDAAALPLTYSRVHFLVKPWAKVPMSSTYCQFWKDVILDPH